MLMLDLVAIFAFWLLQLGFLLTFNFLFRRLHFCVAEYPHRPLRGLWWRIWVYKYRMWRHRKDPLPSLPVHEGRL